MFTNLLNHVIVWVYGIYRGLITRPDYYIEGSEIEYVIDPEIPYEIKDLFWKAESRHWDAGFESYHVNTTHKKMRADYIPECVKRITCRYKYWYGGKIYKLITNNPRFKIPNDIEDDFKFVIPINEAYILDTDDKPVRDITEKIKRYSGPKRDFHNEKVPIRDLLYYDVDTLEKEYPKIKMTNVIGMSKTVSTVDGFTSDLHLS
jgi:hypothetical protein